MDESSELVAAPRVETGSALDGAPSLDHAISGPKLSRHHRRNSTVQEQRALRAKAAENELMLSMPRVRFKLMTKSCLAIGFASTRRWRRTFQPFVRVRELFARDEARWRFGSQLASETEHSRMQETTTPINPETTTSRYIPWNVADAAPAKHERNAVSTAKYDPYFVTFLPIFLFEMFSRVAYLYFLFQARFACVRGTMWRR